jgi:hypothetical protein
MARQSKTLAPADKPGGAGLPIFFRLGTVGFKEMKIQMRRPASSQKAALTRKLKAAGRKEGRLAASREASRTPTNWFGLPIRTGWIYLPSRLSNFEGLN